MDDQIIKLIKATKETERYFILNNISDYFITKGCSELTYEEIKKIILGDGEIKK